MFIKFLKWNFKENMKVVYVIAILLLIYVANSLSRNMALIIISSLVVLALLMSPYLFHMRNNFSRMYGKKAYLTHQVKTRTSTIYAANLVFGFLSTTIISLTIFPLLMYLISLIETPVGSVYELVKTVFIPLIENAAIKANTTVFMIVTKILLTIFLSYLTTLLFLDFLVVFCNTGPLKKLGFYKYILFFILFQVAIIYILFLAGNFVVGVSSNSFNIAIVESIQFSDGGVKFNPALIVSNIIQSILYFSFNSVVLNKYKEIT